MVYSVYFKTIIHFKMTLFTSTQIHVNWSNITDIKVLSTHLYECITVKLDKTKTMNTRFLTIMLQYPARGTSWHVTGLDKQKNSA